MTARTVLEEINAAGVNASVPAKHRGPLAHNFDEHITTLTAHRAKLEEIQSSLQYDKMDLPEIKPDVIRMQQDAKSWKQLQDLFK